MFDAKQLLDQVMASLPNQQAGANRPAGSSNNSQLLKGALAGGVIGLLAGNKRARKMAGKSAGTALKLGGLAAVAAIGYTAWQRHKAAGAGAGTGGAVAATGLQLPPPQSGFALEQAPGGADVLARGILVAMIQGAKADGHIDSQEHAKIFEHVQSLALDAEAKAFVMDELAAPHSVERVRQYAQSPETATELYAASLLAMDPDSPTERAYLDRLAQAMNLEAGLAAQIEQAVRQEL